MKITININTGNAAFEDNPSEIEDILKSAITGFVQYGERERSLRDNNGNKVGNFKVTGKNARQI